MELIDRAGNLSLIAAIMSGEGVSGLLGMDVEVTNQDSAGEGRE